VVAELILELEEDKAAMLGLLIIYLAAAVLVGMLELVGVRDMGSLSTQLRGRAVAAQVVGLHMLIIVLAAAAAA
jgi:hypothetical protein